jgi:serine phosphatase RsbU (regulator of sigma subunit)
MMILFAILYYKFLLSEFDFQNKSIQENLRIFVYLLGILYLSVIIIKILLNPSFSPESFPRLPQTLGSVIYANVVSLFAILFMTPLVIVFKNLIYYKRTVRTIFLMRMFLFTSIACIVVTVLTGAALDLNFSGLGFYNNFLLIVVLFCILLLSLRNSWITYLSRKEKVSYFIISVFLIWAVIYLFSFAFEHPVPAHSLAVGSFANITWLFLVSYMIFSSFYLLLQLPTARVFDRKMKEVASLHDLSRAISAEFNFNKLIKLITEMTTKVIESESTWLELYENGSKRLYIASSHNLSPIEITAFQKSNRQDLSEQILLSKRPIMLNEIPKSHPYYYIKSWKSDIGSIIGVPLISGNGKSLGILFATKRHSFGFDPDDQAMLEAYANQAVIGLDNAQLLRQSLERERLEEELRIARDVQKRLLPQKIPKFDNISIESLTIPAYEVGGDYFDFIKLPDENMGIIIGDVSGKGTSAAFYMAEAKGVVQSLSKSFSEPRDLLIRTNEILYESLERKMFISMLMASMDCKNRILKFARAGHCPLLYYNSNKEEVRLLQPEGIGVGLEKGKIFQDTLVEETIHCTPGDIYVFYTDGLSEARNTRGDEFGDDRLCDLIRKNAKKPVSELKNIILDSILNFLNGQNLADDLTLLIVKSL